MIPRLNEELRSMQEKQQKIQELKPKIEEVSKVDRSLSSHLASLGKMKKN